MPRSLLYVALVIGLSGCGAGDGQPGDAIEAAPGTTAPATTATTTARPIDSMVVDPSPSPPPIQVRGGGRELSLIPWSYCWSGERVSVCADGQPPESPPDIGSPAEIEVVFPVPGFRFTATAERHGETCGRQQTVALEPTGPTTYRLRPIGAAGDYDIRLSGRGGPESTAKGDLSASFRWHTPRDGPPEAPHATASIVSGRGSDVDIRGGELSIQDLRETPGPGRVSATAVVESSDGVSTTIDFEPSTDFVCIPEGSIFFKNAEPLEDVGAALGAPPFRYHITLVIDSTAYRATSTWPDDVDPQCSPCTPLTFSPPLPGI